MPQTLKAAQNILNPVDYFKAKLQFEMGPHELAGLLEKGSIMVLDVRDPQSYAKEHIKGAVNVPLQEIPKRLREIPKDKTIVLYCWNLTCHLAPKAALELAHKDYKVQELVGGIEEWKKAGFPLEGASTAAPDPKATLQPQEGRWEGEGGSPTKAA